MILGGILASAANTNKISPDTALSSYTSMGVYVSNAKSITETITDLPDGASTSYGFNLIVISAYNTIQFGTQIFIQNGKIFTRYNTASGNTPSYTAWKQIYDTSLLTDSSLLSSLGLALGVLKYQDFLTNTNLPQGTFASMKDANMNGLYGFSSTNIVPSDAPPGVENGAILNITFYSSVTLQICFDRGSANTGGSMYSRFYWYGTWFPWK